MNRIDVLKLAPLALCLLFPLVGCTSPMAKYSKYEKPRKFTVPHASGEGKATFYRLEVMISGRGLGFESRYGLADSDGDILFKPTSHKSRQDSARSSSNGFVREQSSYFRT